MIAEAGLFKFTQVLIVKLRLSRTRQLIGTAEVVNVENVIIRYALDGKEFYNWNANMKLDGEDYVFGFTTMGWVGRTEWHEGSKIDMLSRNMSSL